MTEHSIGEWSKCFCDSKFWECFCDSCGRSPTDKKENSRTCAIWRRWLSWKKKKVDTDKASPARLSYDAASCVRNETWRCVYLSGWQFWISISGSESRLGLRSVTLSRSAFDTLNEPPWAMHPMGKQIFYASYCGCQVKQIKFLSSARMTWKLRK